jgi:hypothetical protein
MTQDEYRFLDIQVKDLMLSVIYYITVIDDTTEAEIEMIQKVMMYVDHTGFDFQTDVIPFEEIVEKLEACNTDELTAIVIMASEVIVADHVINEEEYSLLIQLLVHAGYEEEGSKNFVDEILGINNLISE